MISKEFVESNPDILYELTSENPDGGRMFGVKGDIVKICKPVTFLSKHYEYLANGDEVFCSFKNSKSRPGSLESFWVPLKIMREIIPVVQYKQTQSGDLEDDL